MNIPPNGKGKPQNSSRLKFSVAMSVYKNDDPEYFKDSLNSILNQTFEPDEIVLVIDGPIPGELRQTIQFYVAKNKCIKPIWFETNKGLGEALRIAVENCQNNLIARMDSDDISVPERFEKQIKLFEKNPNLSVVGSNICEFIGSIENVIGIREVPQENDQIKDFLRKRCPFNHVTVMFKKDEVLKVGNYQDWFWNEDYYLWIRMYINGAVFQNLEESLVYVRVGEEMYQRRGGWSYFLSEAKLQRFMLQNTIINFNTYLRNLAVRFFIQIHTCPK